MFIPVFSPCAKDLGELRTHIVVNYSPPSCDIYVPNSIQLGKLTHGTKRHKHFSISVSCPDARTTTAITASSGSRVLDGVSMQMISSGGGPNGSYLKLLNNGQYINLTGSQQVCRKSGAWSQCDITPETVVHREDKKGDFNGFITFRIVYPT